MSNHIAAMLEHGTAYQLGQYNEVIVALTRALPKALLGTNPKSTIKAVQNGKAVEKLLFDMISLLMRGDAVISLACDMTRAGWRLIEDTREPEEFKVADLELISFTDKKEGHISSEEMRKQAKKLGASLGQYHAEYILEHQEDIPEEYRCKCPPFPGTLWSDPRECLHMPFLKWEEEEKKWHMYFIEFSCGWDQWDRLFRLRR